MHKKVSVFVVCFECSNKKGLCLKEHFEKKIFLGNQTFVNHIIHNRKINRSCIAGHLWLYL